MDDATTPTRANFSTGAQFNNGGQGIGMATQKPLPLSPFPEGVSNTDESTHKKTHTRANSSVSKKSRNSDEMDVDDSDNDTAGEEDCGDSDGEGSVNADGTRSSKKKKGNQRFFCKGYPPCKLSFTRSEHLARHIRKHTGERPFQCHCQRRFSRLDNLRQHAQTVHVNEDIPFDSLAATGTRYQRQIRTDRVQRGGGRARASTAGSAGGPARGHSKSLSTSSIASISSVGSGYSTRDDIRRRPAPLVMATDPNARLSIESYHSVGSAQFSYRGASPSDYSTPTSATFSTGQSSPHWGSGVGSPATAYSRAHAMYPSGSRTPGRRLSVPSVTGGNPFHSPHGASGNLGRPLFGNGSMNASNTAALGSPGGSYLTSPTNSTASGWSRRESVTSAAEEAWRRRTWHPDSNNFTTPGSRLSQVITSSQLNLPHDPLPALNNNNRPQQHQQTVRLPGIDSLLPKPGQQLSPPPGPPSPRTAEYERRSRVPLLPSASISDERRNMPQWEMSLHRGITRLDINNTTPPPQRDGAGAWANEVHQAMQARVEPPPLAPRPQLTVRFDTQPQVVGRQPPPPLAMSGPPRGHHHTMSAPLMPSGLRESKRHGWYNGPSTVHEDRVLEGRPPRIERMAHPNLHAFTGFPSREEAERRRSENADSRRFDALVAVATSEGSTATAC
ncbi:unnamed protein product [Discula destructiva]